MNTKVLVVAASAAVIVLIVGGLIMFGRTSDSEESTTTGSPTPATLGVSTNLVSTDLVVGTGAEAVSGKTVSVNYRGTLADGAEFDSSYKRNQPFEFVLGVGQVIKGWDQGVVGMKVGGKRKLVIPPDLAYGPQAVGSIPANSTLTFEVELLAVK